MDSSRLKELQDFSKSLTAEELACMISCNVSRVTVYMGLAEKSCMTSTLESATPNGGLVQLNVPAFGPLFEDEVK